MISRRSHGQSSASPVKDSEVEEGNVEDRSDVSENH